MRRTIVCVLVLVALAGCGPAPTGPGGGPSSQPGGGQSTGGHPGPGSTTPSGGTPRPGLANLSSATRVQIFAAVLRSYLMPPDSLAQVPIFTSVWVLDHTNEAVNDPMGGARSVGPITPDEQAGIIAALADVLPVKFIADRSEVIETVNGCARVRDGGVLIALGPPRGGPDRVEVGINAFVACLNAIWQTDVVVRQTGGWTVTGTTGPVAIA
jgi:hypothetical protein